MLLKLSVRAGLPLISIQTDDPLNVRMVLGEVLGKTVHEFPKKAVNGKNVYTPSEVKPGHIYVMFRAGDAMNWRKLHDTMVNKHATVIVVNPDGPRHEVFDAGFVTCPESLIRRTVADRLDEDAPHDEHESLVSALSGLSYQNVVNLILLAEANSGQFSSRSVREVRRIFFGNVRGLQQESTDTGFYLPSPQLEAWLGLDGQLFLSEAPAMLRPRGVLMDGPPGTGKTQGAKYIARELGLPLYRFDIGATMNKYVGESEKGMEQALAQAERCAPCVMLVDEVEKLFTGGSSDSGVTTRALSKLLWWLQEHRSRILVVMTTNDVKKLPPELIRPGRIDCQFYFGELKKDEALHFLRQAAKSMKKHVVITAEEVATLHGQIVEGAETLNGGASASVSFSHATLHQHLLQFAKKKYLKANHSKEQ